MIPAFPNEEPVCRLAAVCTYENHKRQLLDRIHNSQFEKSNRHADR